MLLNDIFTNNYLIEFYHASNVILMTSSIVISLIVLIVAMVIERGIKPMLGKAVRITAISLAYLFAAFLLGNILLHLDVEIKVSFIVFINIAFLLSVFLIGRIFYMFVIYHFSCDKVLHETLGYFKIIILVISGVLSGNGYFALFELLLLLTILYILGASEVLVTSITNLNYRKKSNEDNLQGETPIVSRKNLFESRKRQLDQLISYFRAESERHQSIGIRGTWGAGKTSFVNVLKKSIGAEIIHIIPSMHTDVESMFKQMTHQLDDIFRKHGIYTGRGSNLRKYTEYIVTLFASNSSGWLNVIDDMIYKDTSIELHDVLVDLEKDIEKLNSKTSNDGVLFIFDDLDRCSKELIEETIKFFSTILSIKGFSKIFLFDGEQIRKNDIVDEFIEKYFDTLVDISQLKHSEIVDFIEDKKIYLDSKADDFDDVLWKKIDDFKIEHRYYLEEILVRIKNRIEEMNEENQTDDDKDLDKENYVRKMKELYDSFSRDINNPRYVKRYYREMKRLLILIDKLWFRNDYRKNSEHTDLDWISTLSSVVAFKVFFSSRYDEAMKYNNIIELDKDEDLSLYNANILKNNLIGRLGGNSTVLQFIMFDIYKLSTEGDRPTSQVIKSEIEKGNVRKSNIVTAFESIIWDDSSRVENARILVDSINKIDEEKEKKKVTLSVFELIESRTSSTREIELEVFTYMFDELDEVLANLAETEKVRLVDVMNRTMGHYLFGCGYELGYYLEKWSILSGDLQEFRDDLYVSKVDDLAAVFSRYFPDIRIDQGKNVLSEIKSVLNKKNDSITGDDMSILLLEKAYISLVDKIEVVEYLQSKVTEYEKRSDVDLKSRDSINGSGYGKIENGTLKSEVGNIASELEGINSINIGDDILTYFTSLCKDIDGANDIEIDSDLVTSLKDIYFSINNKLSKDHHHRGFWEYTYFRILRIEIRISKTGETYEDKPVSG